MAMFFAPFARLNPEPIRRYVQKNVNGGPLLSEQIALCVD